jgi:2-polyprenyl-6-methoxyphenol hydroxylase-like FAD-dependent oxidoreductase
MNECSNREDSGMPDVIIVGAGVAGLATALRLHRLGWDTLVVERAPGRRRGGYLVNLLGTGYDAAERLGILPALRAYDLGMFTTMLVRADGRAKFTVPHEVALAAVGDRALTVFRSDLESVLYEAVHEHTEIRCSTTVAALEQDGRAVRVVLSDGTEHHADLLVGADGLHSGVRALAFGPHAGARVDLPYVAAAFTLDRPPAGVPENAGATFIGPGRTAALAHLSGARSAAFFAYRSDDPRAELRRGPADALAAAFGDLGGGVPEALRQLGSGAPGAAYFDVASQVMLPRWSTGRVVLLGDSAWCVTLFAGYGAALALAGADRLGTALAGHGADVTAALRWWENGLRDEVGRRQAIAHRGASRFVPPTRAHVRANELILRAIRLPVVRGLVRRGIERANR